MPYAFYEQLQLQLFSSVGSRPKKHFHAIQTLHKEKLDPSPPCHAKSPFAASAIREGKYVKVAMGIHVEIT